MTVPADMNAAMATYVREYLLFNPSSPFVLDADSRRDIENFREAARRDEGGGGMCHLVTEYLMARRGVARMGVSYLSRDGEIICAGHYVNVLADGTILDGTADQFGEGHGVRLLRPDFPEYGRYRPEFDEDWNPAVDPRLPQAWRAAWEGRPDYLVQDEIREERGYGWWVADNRTLLAYCRRQKEYAMSNQAPWAGEDRDRFQFWIDEAEAQASGFSPR